MHYPDFFKQNIMSIYVDRKKLWKDGRESPEMLGTSALRDLEKRKIFVISSLSLIDECQK